MLKFFENLKSAPTDVRQTFAVITSGIFTVIIVGASLIVSNPLAVDAGKTEEKKENLPSPFAALTSNMGESFRGIKNDISAIPVKELLSGMFQQIASSTKRTAGTAEVKNASSTEAVASSTVYTLATTTEATSTPAKITPKSKATSTKPTIKTSGTSGNPFTALDAKALTAASALSQESRSTVKPKPKPEVTQESDPSPVKPIALPEAETTTTTETNVSVPPSPTPSTDTPVVATTTQSQWPKTYTSGVGH